MLPAVQNAIADSTQAGKARLLTDLHTSSIFEVSSCTLSAVACALSQAGMGMKCQTVKLPRYSTQPNHKTVLSKDIMGTGIGRPKETP